MKMLVIILFLASCGLDNFKYQTTTTSASISSAPASCLCATTFSPVCGKEDGKSYENACMAKCFGNQTWSSGNCSCNKDIVVCGSDGKNYNECEAREQKISITKFVPCEVLEN